MLPPLRARREDLGLIIGDVLRHSEIPGVGDLRLATAVGRRIFAYDWPLNIRELQQCLSVSAALSPRGVIEAEHLSNVSDSAACALTVERDLEDPEALRRILVSLLERHRGNISRVARDMGKARMQIHRWMQRFDLDPDTFRS